MHLYLNYAREHWSQPEENPPVGIIFCAGKGGAFVRSLHSPTKNVLRLSLIPFEKNSSDGNKEE